MNKIVLVWACLVCGGHGRQVQPSTQNQKVAKSARDVTSGSLRDRSGGPVTALAALLLSDDPASAFSLAGPGSQPSNHAALKSVRTRSSKGRHSNRVGKVLGAVVAKDTSIADNAKDKKFYKGREFPKVGFGIKVGLRRVTVITGSSSGLGLAAMKALVDQGHFIIAAVRDPEKMDIVAQENGISKDNYVAMYLELASLQSVKDFVDNLKAYLPTRPINNLICNAAVYRPTDPKPAWTDDGFEMSMGINHLGHFLLVQLLLPELKRSKGARCIIVGSVTGNSNTIAGSFVKPVANVGKLEGLRNAGKQKSAMVSSVIESFDGAKAYKDAKALNMMTVIEMHRRYHKDTGVVFGSLYPGCITDTNLFREKRQWFRTYWPKFMKFIGAYVSEDEAGRRLALTVIDPKCEKSGVYWSWNGNAQQLGLDGAKSGAGGAGGEMFENQFAPMIADEKNGRRAFDYSMELVKDYL